ncbi:MBL fold metallo-hydrolase [Aeromonas sobria]|uniref:MBL fold metallo-hydrolase n=1 Tax=Aeromonas sobria TaxID=646 RepID=A0A2N3J5S7_AERSO|nr:MBL fold metallo-hydrolase [Aeromonas sobria]PKQ81782.1 MBL fold metallo-hydrolase [Aeromonas sobria]
MSVCVRILQANHGDCILVSHEGPLGVFNLLIDGGNAPTFRYGPRGRYAGALCHALDELKEKGQHIDLAILTHIDDDHIDGLKKAFEKTGYLGDMTKSIWFNSSRLITCYFKTAEIPENNIYLSDDTAQTSIKQGKEFEALLEEIGCRRESVIIAGKTHEIGPFTFKILSPDEEKLNKLLHKWPTETDSGVTSAHENDYSLSLEDIWKDDFFVSDKSVYNGSSIAFILEADGKAMLFLGDSHEDIIIRNLRALGYSEDNKLNAELVKISHHGSQYNTSVNFLSLINSPRHIISTNGLKHGLPNKRTIARILASSHGNIYFNYKSVIDNLLLPTEIDTYSSRFEAIEGEIWL